MLTALAPVGAVDRLHDGAEPARDAGRRARGGWRADSACSAEAIADPIDAPCAQACGHGRTVVVAGSIFLIGPVREWLARDILR